MKPSRAMIFAFLLGFTLTGASLIRVFLWN